MSLDGEPTTRCKYCGKPVPDGTRCMDCTITDLEMPESWLATPQVTEAPAYAALMNSATDQRFAVAFPKCKIGRDKSNQIVIDEDAYASRFHAWITFEDGHYFVEDLGSTNGTLLNGSPLTNRRPLVNGDRIRIGRTDFTFILERTAAPSSVRDKHDVLSD